MIWIIRKLNNTHLLCNEKTLQIVVDICFIWSLIVIHEDKRPLKRIKTLKLSEALVYKVSSVIGHVLLEHVKVQDLRESTGHYDWHVRPGGIQLRVSRISRHQIWIIEWQVSSVTSRSFQFQFFRKSNLVYFQTHSITFFTNENDLNFKH